MIGVAVPAEEQGAAREFFELCKTSWEFSRPGADYEVLITTARRPSDVSARLVLIFDPRTTTSAERFPPLPLGRTILHRDRPIPIYGETAIFAEGGLDVLTDAATGRPVAAGERASSGTVIHLGYNLFAEIRFLLTKGQPVDRAGIATLELHITILRDLVTRAGRPFVEIPPVPEGHAFIACLTHDIDHPILRNHRFDPTMLGFLYRSTCGSLVDLCRGRKSLRRVLQNWSAAAMLPLVYAGIARDRWRDFVRYLELEAGLNSTFFFIPRKGYAGRQPAGPAPALRACGYDLAELRGELRQISAARSEIGLHGLDAWLDVGSARAEGARIRAMSGQAATGVRMHWLYFGENTPAVLDEAGFGYDSTFGYNQTVGFRAGTAQAFRPFAARNLLELPLHVMDTALFYPSHLHLAEPEARRRVGAMIDDVAGFGGALTINWHDRSISAERLWGEFYCEMLHDLVKRRAWCPPAAQAVAWFRKRRAARIAYRQCGDDSVEVVPTPPPADSLPPLIMRVHQPCRRPPGCALAAGPAARFVDLPMNGQSSIRLPSTP